MHTILSAMPWIWGAVIVAAIAVEAATSGLVAIWFMAGAVVALVLSLFDVNLWVQLGVFLLTALALLTIARPLLSKFLLRRHPYTPTGVDRLIGQSALATEDITQDGGAVRIEGQVWTARLLPREDLPRDASLPAGCRAVIRAIEGNKLLVEAEESAPARQGEENCR